MKRRRVHIGISTCPNDTFAFHGLISGQVDSKGLDFQFDFLDIQELNERLFDGDFDLAKTSFHAALQLADQTRVLGCGSALGFGVGPLLLASAPESTPTGDNQVTLCPGRDTTATLLMRLFYPGITRIKQVVFHEIMPMLQAGKADFGVCIHEGRFTWREQGLHLVEDLGTRWETQTDCPLPLGGLVVRRNLDPEMTRLAESVIRDSILHGLANRQSTLPTMRHHAQEFDDDVLMQHVDLYVNDWTVDLGDVGRRALAKLSEMAKHAGVVDADAPPIQVSIPS